MHGKAAFGPVTRFDVSGRRTTRAALLPEPRPLADAVLAAVGQACRSAGLDPADPDGGPPVLLALHSDRHTRAALAEVSAGTTARWGGPGVLRAYTGACVAAGTAVADAAQLVATGRRTRVLVAAGHLVEPGVFAAFDMRPGARPGRRTAPVQHRPQRHPAR